MRNARTLKIKPLGPRKKTDSSNMPSKVALRLWLLERMGIKDVYCLDTCSGLGTIWTAMSERDEVTIRQWTRIDIKPRKAGVLKLDATEAIERMPLETYNVIDIDPYGSPWEPYISLIQRLKTPTAVFLTSCQMGGRGMLSASMCAAAGIPEDWAYLIPKEGVAPRFIAEQVLSRTVDFVDVVHAARMVLDPDTNIETGRAAHGHAFITYYALGLKPKVPGVSWLEANEAKEAKAAAAEAQG